MLIREMYVAASKRLEVTVASLIHKQQKMQIGSSGMYDSSSYYQWPMILLSISFALFRM